MKKKIFMIFFVVRTTFFLFMKYLMQKNIFDDLPVNYSPYSMLIFLLKLEQFAFKRSCSENVGFKNQ